jgi:tRNA(adenine34) deaminase
MNYEKYMKKVIKLSEKASIIGEVPVAAIIIKENKIVSKAYNIKEKKKDPTQHAEIIAIKKACKKTNNWRLNKCLLFVNLEPCIMCFGAIIESRINTIVCGTINEKYHNEIVELSKKHNIKIIYNVLQEECSKKLKTFFNNKR